MIFFNEDKPVSACKFTLAVLPKYWRQGSVFCYPVQGLSQFQGSRNSFSTLICLPGNVYVVHSSNMRQFWVHSQFVAHLTETCFIPNMCPTTNLQLSPMADEIRRMQHAPFCIPNILESNLWYICLINVSRDSQRLMFLPKMCCHVSAQSAITLLAWMSRFSALLIVMNFQSHLSSVGSSRRNSSF